MIKKIIPLQFQRIPDFFLENLASLIIGRIFYLVVCIFSWVIAIFVIFFCTIIRI